MRAFANNLIDQEINVFTKYRIPVYILIISTVTGYYCCSIVNSEQERINE